MRRPINRAYFTMVALDEKDKPTEIPGLLIETEEENGNGMQPKEKRNANETERSKGFKPSSFYVLENRHYVKIPLIL